MDLTPLETVRGAIDGFRNRLYRQKERAVKLTERLFRVRERLCSLRSKIEGRRKFGIIEIIFGYNLVFFTLVNIFFPSKIVTAALNDLVLRASLASLQQLNQDEIDKAQVVSLQFDLCLATVSKMEEFLTNSEGKTETALTAIAEMTPILSSQLDTVMHLLDEVIARTARFVEQWDRLEQAVEQR